MAKKKGDCYQVAAHLLIELSWDALRLCHGTPIGRGEENMGKRFGHAWVEFPIGDAWFVIDRSNGLDVSMERDRYYEIGQIKADEVMRYDREQLAHMIRDYGTYGPWHDDGVEI